MKSILSIIEAIIAGVIIFKITVPTFISLSKTEIGNWAYLGLLSIVIIVVLVEYSSFKKNKATWVVSKIFDLFLNK